MSSDSYRWNTIKNNFGSSEDIKKFLNERIFSIYYDKVLENIKTRDNNIIKKSSMDVVKSGIRGLNFSELDKIDIIKDNSVSLLVNCELPWEEFSDVEQKFIGSNKYGNISGEHVWSKYNEFILNFKSGYVDRKIDTKIWSSILSKFSISIRNQNLLRGMDKGRLPLLKEEFYSFDEGTDPTVLNSDSLVK